MAEPLYSRYCVMFYLFSSSTSKLLGMCCYSAKRPRDDVLTVDSHLVSKEKHSGFCSSEIEKRPNVHLLYMKGVSALSFCCFTHTHGIKHKKKLMQGDTDTARPQYL